MNLKRVINKIQKDKIEKNHGRKATKETGRERIGQERQKDIRKHIQTAN